MAVYFIKNPVSGFVKIGKSQDVNKRFKELCKQHDTSLEKRK